MICLNEFGSGEAGLLRDDVEKLLQMVVADLSSTVKDFEMLKVWSTVTPSSELIIKAFVRYQMVVSNVDYFHCI